MGNKLPILISDETKLIDVLKAMGNKYEAGYYSLPLYFREDHYGNLIVCKFEDLPWQTKRDIEDI